MNPQHIDVLKVTSLGLICLMLSACDTAPTQVDRHFGMAVRQAQMQQAQQLGSMHERHHPSTSTDGVSAQSAVERYQESFQTPPTPAPIFNIGLGATRTR